MATNKLCFSISTYGNNRSDKDNFNVREKMKINQAIEILKAHNIWRRGADTEITDVINYGIAIDTVVEYFERTKKGLKNE